MFFLLKGVTDMSTYTQFSVCVRANPCPSL